MVNGILSMSLPFYEFSGSTFFADIRAKLNMGQGMFAGGDFDVQFVVMDALLYKMNCFIRPDNSDFTDAAIELMGNSRTRVVINGNFFVNDYNLLTPKASKGWYGQVIKDGVTIPNPAITTGLTNDEDSRNRAFFGREAGSAIWRYHVGFKCAPHNWAFCLPRVYETQQGIILDQAMGGILPLIVNKSEVKTWWSAAFLSRGVGKTIFGIHEDSGCLFVISQDDRGTLLRFIEGGLFGETVENIAKKLMKMGVTHALLGDGASSAALIIDGQVYTAPTLLLGPLFSNHKDHTIPIGLAYELSDLNVGGPATDGTFEVFGPTHDPGTDDEIFLQQYPENTTWNGVQAVIAARTQSNGGGLSLTISSLGDRGSPWPTVLDAMALGGVPGAPLLLSSDGTDLKAGVLFFFAPQTPSLSISLTGQVRKPANPRTDPNDYFEGTLKVLKIGSKIAGKIRAKIQN